MGIDKPTPGEWSTSGQLIVSEPFAHPNPKAEPTAKTIAAVCWDYNGDSGATESRIPWSEAAANMRLIAAAPKLLAALEGLFTHCAMVHKHWGEGSNGKEAAAAIAAAHAAINSATGA